MGEVHEVEDLDCCAFYFVSARIVLTHFRLGLVELCEQVVWVLVLDLMYPGLFSPKSAERH